VPMTNPRVGRFRIAVFIGTSSVQTLQTSCSPQDEQATS
jgi:hypothetical protein